MVAILPFPAHIWMYTEVAVLFFTEPNDDSDATVAEINLQMVIYRTNFDHLIDIELRYCEE